MTRKLIAFVLFAMVAGCQRSGARADYPDGSPSESRARAAVRLVEQGRAYAEAGDSLRAQQYFSAGLKSGADETVVLPLLLRACVEERNYRYAAEVAEAALARRPADARLRFLAGAIYGSLGDTAHARVHLERAARELGTDAEVQFSVGVFFRDEASEVAIADGYFRRYLALAPSGTHADEARGSLMERLERAEAAQ
ncbi:MAG: hypothetical protein JST00_20605 [Deltaproteobacteria bacterium]|nr:hypothetical protein [Deltaproteobacteria bacterium]